MDDIIKRYFEAEKDIALLIIGRDAYDTLKSLFEKTSGYESSWIENPKDEIEFWSMLLGPFGELSGRALEYLKKGDLKSGYDLTCDVLRALNNRYHVFIPRLDKLFYSLAGSKFDSRLRVLWSNKKNNLNLYCSAENPDSLEYKVTLGEDEFMFYEANFTIKNLNSL